MHPSYYIIIHHFLRPSLQINKGSTAIRIMMMTSCRCLNVTIKVIFLLSAVVAGQQQDPYGDYGDYNDYAGDYGQDNLYSDYAAHKDGG
jgi:hypothetical protein